MNFLLQSAVNYWEMASRFPENTAMASNSGSKESYSGKRESNQPLIQVSKKWNWHFPGAQCRARLQQIWCILPGTPKWQKPLSHFFIGIELDGTEAFPGMVKPFPGNCQYPATRRLYISSLNQVLNQIWISDDLDLNQFWLRLEKYNLLVAECCQLLGNTAMASNPGSKESYSGKRKSNWPLIQGIPKN